MCQMVQVKTNFDTEIEVSDIKKDIIENIVEVAGVCTQIRQIIFHVHFDVPAKYLEHTTKIAKVCFENHG